jgi:hypothetical protein
MKSPLSTVSISETGRARKAEVTTYEISPSGETS